MRRQLLKLFGLAAVSGCAQAQIKSRSVSTYCFNYTDRGIDQVSVDGVFAGIAYAYGGEGRSVEGLLAPTDAKRVAVMHVKWVISSIYNIEKDNYTRIPVENFETTVELAWPYPPNPDSLVLHFYPDGHVEAELGVGRVKWRIPRPAGYHH